MRGAEPAGVAVEHRVVVVEVKVSHHVVRGVRTKWHPQRRGDAVEALERDVPGRVVAVDAARRLVVHRHRARVLQGGVRVPRHGSLAHPELPLVLERHRFLSLGFHQVDERHVELARAGDVPDARIAVSHQQRPRPALHRVVESANHAQRRSLRSVLVGPRQGEDAKLLVVVGHPALPDEGPRDERWGDRLSRGEDVAREETPLRHRLKRGGDVGVQFIG
mmetsp:Transcript_7241/g.31954  ORF Transcript_7241/g.31954 Transcript_7241/m.31954 type:complete len:220 (+) Transcript_7241:648-1307(+)